MAIGFNPIFTELTIVEMQKSGETWFYGKTKDPIYKLVQPQPDEMLSMLSGKFALHDGVAAMSITVLL